MSDFDHAIEEARRLAGTPEGKQLAAQLQQLGGCDVQKILNAAAAGDMNPAKQAIHSLMQDPQARRLLELLGGSHGK